MAEIVVVGAGAVGSYYGALLARAGHDVTLVARGPHLDAMRRSGAVTVQEADGTTWRAPVTALADPPAGARPALAVITTKAHHTDRAARALRPALGPRTPVLSLQNGVTNVARAGRVLGERRMLAGQAFVGLHVAEPGVVVHASDPARGVVEEHLDSSKWLGGCFSLPTNFWVPEMKEPASAHLLQLPVADEHLASWDEEVAALQREWA